MKMNGIAQHPSLPLKRKSHIRLLILGTGRLRAQAGNTNSRIAPDITQCRALASASRDLCHLQNTISTIQALHGLMCK